MLSNRHGISTMLLLATIIAACGAPPEDLSISCVGTLVACGDVDPSMAGEWSGAMVIEDINVTYDMVLRTEVYAGIVNAFGLCPDGSGDITAHVNGDQYTWGSASDSVTCNVPESLCPHHLLTYSGGSIKRRADGGIDVLVSGECGDRIFQGAAVDMHH